MTIDDLIQAFDKRFPVPAPPKHAVRDFLRKTLITLRCEFLEEEIKELEMMKKPINKRSLTAWSENDPITLSWEVRERNECNALIQTLIDKREEELKALSSIK